MIFENQEQLDECVEKWQKILRLQDWEIQARVKRRNDMPNPDCYGNCQVHPVHHAAEISIEDACDHLPFFAVPLDHEQILVHELLHVSLEGVQAPEGERTPDSCRVLEVHIVHLARALVMLDRATYSTMTIGKKP